MKQTKLLFAIISFIIILTSCSEDKTEETTESESKTETNEEQQAQSEVEAVDATAIQLSQYAPEIDFSLDKPAHDGIEADTTLHIEGRVGQFGELNKDHLWVVLTAEEAIEDLDTDEFHYFIPLEEDAFSHGLNLHHGEGEYEISVRAPSNDPNEEDRYYDVASFAIVNQDKDIQREIEYTEYGVANDIQLTSPTLGLEEHEANVSIEGTVPDDYAGERLLVQMDKDNENRQITLPVEGNAFFGDVPLYFGEGVHSIRVQGYNEEDELFYDSASFFADNQTAMAFAEMETFSSYTERGVTLHEPTWQQEALQHELAYNISGEIDPDLTGAEDITHVIVTVNKPEEDVESGYLIPVENYQFNGEAFFRFGPGDYEVIVNVPDLEQQDQSMFYFEGVAKVNHQVEDISDGRALLPARGIESDHPAIIQQAEEITTGLENDRDKAKAVYEFVAKHVAYDVPKAENDMFNLEDSALTTLESGIGICQDYAFLATALLRALGMEANFIEGFAGERHAWVEVMVGGDWLVMDPTWGAGYVQDGEFHAQYNEDYFDPEQAFFEETHQRDGIMY